MSAAEGIERVGTARLRLERWDPARHTVALAELNADPEVMRGVGEARPATRAESEGQSGRMGAHWERFGFGLWAVHVADERAVLADEPTTGRFVGFAGLSHPLWLPSEADEVEVGWRLRRDAWGHGYATEAGRAGLEKAFGALGLERVISLIRPDNARSQAVARRLGMAIARSVPHPRLPHDLDVWELRADQHDLDV